MLPALIPARYRAFALLTGIVILVGLLTHLHYRDQAFEHQVKHLLSQGVRNGENGPRWYRPWTWDHASPDDMGFSWKEKEEEVAVLAGVEGDRVEATRKRIMGVQSQCVQDGGIWEREYGYVGVC